MNRGQGPIICGKCYKIIGANNSYCPWCGAGRPSPFSKIVRGKLDADWIVKAVVWTNIGYYLLSVLLSNNSFPFFNPFSLFSPDQQSLFILGATGTMPIEKFGRYSTLISASYLHGGLLHLIFNLMAFRQVGPWVCKEYGASRMFIIYTLGGVAGFYLSYIVGIPFTIGASASICALIGSLLYYGKSRGGFYGAAVYRVVSGWVIGLFIFGLILPGINNWGHGGGILGGIIAGKILKYQELSPESSFHNSMALLMALLTAAVLVFGIYQAVIFKGVF